VSEIRPARPRENRRQNGGRGTGQAVPYVLLYEYNSSSSFSRRNSQMPHNPIEEPGSGAKCRWTRAKLMSKVNNSGAGIILVLLLAL